jgi:hypothetical protein
VTALHRPASDELGDQVIPDERWKMDRGRPDRQSFRRLGIFIESVGTGERRRLTTTGQSPAGSRFQTHFYVEEDDSTARHGDGPESRCMRSQRLGNLGFDLQDEGLSSCSKVLRERHLDDDRGIEVIER